MLYWQQTGNEIYQGDALEVLKALPEESIHCVVTSPPYWGLRDYGLPPTIWDGDSECQHVWGECEPRRQRHPDDVKDQNSKQATNKGANCELCKTQFCQICGAWRGCLGLEPTPELFIKHMVEIFREVRRVLRSDGTLFLNLGDSYWGGKGKSGQAWATEHQDRNTIQGSQHQFTGLGETRPSDGNHNIYKPKDLCGIPWRVALALQADGWWLRSDIIWNKPNPMPESVTDRPTKAHEYMFLLTKSAKYFYDADAIKEDLKEETLKDKRTTEGYKNIRGRSWDKDPNSLYGPMGSMKVDKSGRNKRTVWTIPTKPFPQAHFATFPPALIEPCILAGCPKDGTVLDPFFGSGTTAMVAYKHNRKFIGIELSQTYLDDIAIPRIEQETAQLKLW